ncbi:hypothetical protein AXF42_Ash015723 [Apostasia shenzhenica]|uniref:Uncharacterized protein n=1 Tax=Apostasia shenzhenica TaxID=1088818 RepID=A0A2H9ZU47_9ASPA|nr:hypothetical protein AXF42_Ash015723 [Apostasia shenzhenica]
MVPTTTVVVTTAVGMIVLECKQEYTFGTLLLLVTIRSGLANIFCTPSQGLRVMTRSEEGIHLCISPQFPLVYASTID